MESSFRSQVVNQTSSTRTTHMHPRCRRRCRCPPRLFGSTLPTNLRSPQKNARAAAAGPGGRPTTTQTRLFPKPQPPPICIYVKTSKYDERMTLQVQTSLLTSGLSCSPPFDRETDN